MTLLALDLSTKHTGYAIFDIESKKLIDYGYLKAEVSGIHKMKYPLSGLYKIVDISFGVLELILDKKPDLIVIEEVNKGKNRISQKSLDALHYFVLEDLRQHAGEFLNKIKYMDSGGRTGWRPTLNLKLGDEDKEYNKQLRVTHKGNKRLIAKLKRGWKDVSTRYVNAQYKLDMDHREREYDGDIADAICLGEAFLKRPKKS